MKFEVKATTETRRGVTLVELLVAILISFIVFTGWMKICNIQAVRKESLRYEAVERAAGILDMVDLDRFEKKKPQTGFYVLPVPFDVEAGKFSRLNGQDKNWIWPLFADQDPARFPIGYRVRVDIGDGSRGDWDDGAWVSVELYDRHSVTDMEAGSPFCTLKALVRRHWL